MKNDPLSPALARAVTAQAHLLGAHIDAGRTDILDLVTPTTAELLHWWFGRPRVAARGQLNFHPHQRQAILNTIVAHELVAAPSLRELYFQLAPQALPTQAARAGLGPSGDAHPQYCLRMADEGEHAWIVLALMTWQLLNRKAALAAGWTDARFTHNFLVVAAGPVAHQQLLRTFFGQTPRGTRNFSRSAFVQLAELLIPQSMRDDVFRFMRANTWSHENIGPYTGNGLVAVCERQAFVDQQGMRGEMLSTAAAMASAAPARLGLQAPRQSQTPAALVKHLAALPELMVFNEGDSLGSGTSDAEEKWHKTLQVIAARKGRCFVQIDFAPAPRAHTSREAAAHSPHTLFEAPPN